MEELLIPPPEVLKLLAHEVRWTLVRHLAHRDYCVSEFVRLLALPQNLVSYHLRQLRKAELVTERKSSADERSLYYTLNLSRLLTLYLSAAEELHIGIGTFLPPGEPKEWHLPSPPLRVLFLCTHNSARSQMAEAWLHHLSHGAVEAYSAGSHPASHVHPLAVQVMQAQGIDMSHAVPKPMALFRGQPFDAIVTVCDRMREVCPASLDDPWRLHWSLPDPVREAGTQEEQLQAFEHIASQLRMRLSFLLAYLERACQHERSWSALVP